MNLIKKVAIATLVTLAYSCADSEPMQVHYNLPPNENEPQAQEILPPAQNTCFFGLEKGEIYQYLVTHSDSTVVKYKKCSKNSSGVMQCQNKVNTINFETYKIFVSKNVFFTGNCLTQL